MKHVNVNSSSLLFIYVLSGKLFTVSTSHSSSVLINNFFNLISASSLDLFTYLELIVSFLLKDESIFDLVMYYSVTGYIFKSCYIHLKVPSYALGF